MKKIAVLFSCALGVLLAGCFGTAKKEKREPELVIVNVLDKKYHDDCAIKGSINVPFEQLMAYADAHWDKEQTYVVLYCGNYACTSSGAGARQLKNKGYKHAKAYEGGTAEWLHKGLPVDGPCKSGFLKNYEVPTGYEERAKEDADIIITTEELQEKIAEFGT